MGERGERQRDQQILSHSRGFLRGRVGEKREFEGDQGRRNGGPGEKEKLAEEAWGTDFRAGSGLQNLEEVRGSTRRFVDFSKFKTKFRREKLKNVDN